MATFAPGFTRPGVYVKEVPGQGAPQLPPTFVAAFIGHGSDRFTVTDQAMISVGPNGATGNDSQVLDSEHNIASITSVKTSNNLLIDPSSYTLVNSGAIPFGNASIKFNPGTAPLTGATFYVTYVAYKNPLGDDFGPKVYNEDMLGQLAFHGAPAMTANPIINGVYVANNVSLGAYISTVQGAQSWYSCQLNNFDTNTRDVAPSYGTSLGGTGATGSTATALTLFINNDYVAQTISIPASVTGITAAAAIQAAVQNLTAYNPALQAAYDEFTAGITGSNQLILTSGMAGTNSSVIVTGAAAVGLKLGTANGGVQTGGTGPTFLDLTAEPGLFTATQQALKFLESVDAYVIVPLFPIVSGGINTSILPIVAAHVALQRGLTIQKWRVAILSAQKNTDTGTNPEAKYVTTAKALFAAAGTGDDRVANALAYVSPGTGKVTYGGISYTLDGYAMAAAIAGIMTNPALAASSPISGKPLSGFSEIKDRFNPTQIKLMGNAGVLMIDSEMGAPAPIMDLTTDQTNAVLSQLKFTRAADYVAKSLRTILRSMYTNVNNLGQDTLAAIGTSIKMILQQMAWLHIINDFSAPSVVKDSLDPRQVNVGLNIQLVPDVSWIYIALGVNL